jgi:DNA-binding MarR family transcriptional regulator
MDTMTAGNHSRVARTQGAHARVDGLDATLELFFYTYTGLIAESDRHLAKLSFGRIHHRIMYFVRSRRSLSVADLVGILRITRQGLHRPLRQLIDSGYVDWEPDDQNRRVHLLHLTERGLALEKKVSDMQKTLLKRAFRSVGADKEEGWRQVMSKLAGANLT